MVINDNAEDDAMKDDAGEDDDDEILFTTSQSRPGLRMRKANRSLKFLENGEPSAKRPRPKKRSAIEEVCILPFCVLLIVGCDCAQLFCSEDGFQIPKLFTSAPLDPTIT
jgi:hypothetical protein